MVSQADLDPGLDVIGLAFNRLMTRGLRRGVTIVGSVALAAGTLSSCSDAPNVQAGGATPDTSVSSTDIGATPEAGGSKETLAPTETPSAEPTTESQGESSGIADLIRDSTVVVEVTCLDSKINTVKLDSYAGGVGVEGFSANLWLECGGTGVAVAQLVLGVDDISPTGGALFGISDPTLKGAAVSKDGFMLGSENVDDVTPYNTRYEVLKFNNLDEGSQCWLIGLQDKLVSATARVSIENLDENNVSTGAQMVSCAIVPPGVVQ